VRALLQRWQYWQQPPRRNLLLAAGFLALAVAGLAIGPTAEAHHLAWLDTTAVVVVGGSLGLVMVTGERRFDGLTEMTLTLPSYDRGENVCVIQLRANAGLTWNSPRLPSYLRSSGTAWPGPP
jgi:hypothetical protein